ncbi:site-specific integrase [Microbacterium sp. MPKO10]|uniref:tyrosine-type recombinase/integrase n=1 Tax=Microbacterium sp. MPKO10 TaxID=2989818 RepID=UPI002236BCF3|nr:site-specific integrase [Microbacterium sp. MPKO10]MCW4458791.1 site-specific integrase [Microbacterium sp. MPKO10]
MGSAYSYDTKSGKRWEARYRKPDGKTARKGGFARKRDAEAYIASVEVSKLQGSYIAPSDAQATIGALGADWLAAHKTAVKPSTYHSDESAWRIHVEPKWGERRVGSIRHTEISAWVAELSDSKSPTTVKRVHGVLASILDGAVRDRRISANPARDVKTPRKTSKPRAYLTHRQVERLALASRYPDFIRFLSYTGLRWGEAAGLRVKHVDVKRRRVQVEENAVIVNGRFQVGTPKTHERRAVPYPAFLDDAIKSATKGKSGDAILWPADEGGYLRPGNAQSGWFTGAVKRVRAEDAKAVAEAKAKKQPEPPVMPKVTPHDLRHTAASLAISAGANVKAVQRMLGHASAAMTLDTYTDLFDDDLDTVADALDAARTEQLQR